jgi:hypothetical protein
MVAIAFAVAAPALGLAGPGIGIGAAVAGIAIGLLAAYVDTVLVYPAIFGKKNTKPDSLEGFQISTTDPGSPRWEVFGSRAWVPCHFLWTLNIREETTGGGGGGKGGGGRPFIQTVRVDAGLAACDGPIANFDTLYADERPFWSRQQNRVLLEDYRWSVEPGSGGEAGLLILTATDAEVADFRSAFAGGDAVEFVQLEGFQPFALNGYYRTVAVVSHSTTSRTRMSLRPLQGQIPVIGSPGSSFEPAQVRRIDQGAASHTWLKNLGAWTCGRTTNNPQIPGTPNRTGVDLAKTWVVGSVYRFIGWTAVSGVINGRFKLLRRYLPGVGGFIDNEYALEWAPLEGQTGIGDPGTASLPGLIVRDGESPFVFQDPQQQSSEYIGSDDQPADPALSALQADPPAHRGIAHVSLQNWNLGPHGNIIPRVTALVRSRKGELVASAIRRICERTTEPERIEVGDLRAKNLVGYSIPAGITGVQALQPVMMLHGVAVQDRGGVLTYLDERDLPVVQVPKRHLNAVAPSQRTTTRGFVANRIDETDAPERVLLDYIDPADGENEAEGSGYRAPGSRTRGGRDTLRINLRPVVAWPYDVKRRSREIYRRIRLESYRGKLRLPPSYMDVLPAHCMQFRSNNQEQELLPAATTIGSVLTLRDLIPRTVALRVRFANGQVSTLQDNGAGAFVGFPAGVTASVNSVNYTTGRIDLQTSPALDAAYPPQAGYEYEREWLVRANKATLAGFDFGVECEVVVTTRDDPLPPVPRDPRPGLGGPLIPAVPPYTVHVIDAPSIYVGQSNQVLIGMAIAPVSGAQWRGAVVYQSPNGTDRWTPIGQVASKSVVGTLVANNLPTTLTGASQGYVDWTTELVVDIPAGDTLDDATFEMIGYGENWLLVGDEIIGFHEADAGGGTQWILRGLIRGMRQTIPAMDQHAAGERVVLLTALGFFHGLYYEPPGGFAAAGRDYHFRVVPGGASIDQVSTITTYVVGNSVRPPKPMLLPEGLGQRIGSYVEARWDRRSLDQTTIFGPTPLPAGDFERYEVVAFDVSTAAGLIATLGLEGAIAATMKRRWFVGDEQMGTLLVERRIEYMQADFLSDGFVLNLTPIGFAVYQWGAGGRSPVSDVAFFTPTT